MGENYRIVHAGDPASSFPLTSSGFRHIDPEYLVTSDSTTYPTTRDVIKRRTDEGGEGIIGTAIQEAWKAHDWYFGPISTCYQGGALIPF